MAKILFVEDDIECSSIIKDWLETNDHIVEVVHSAEDALPLLELYGFDLLILDWELDEMSGIELCRRYRAQSGKAPVLMLTGRSDAEQKEEGLDSGADDYLTKPPDPRELAARVRALLRRPAVYTEEILQKRHVKLDAKARTVLVDGKPVSLLPREFSLLEFFMRNPDRTFSSEELLDKVWPSTNAVTPDTVRVCVQRLRGKIDLKGSPSLIRNIYGVGYILDSH